MAAETINVRTMRIGDTEPELDFLLRRPHPDGSYRAINVGGSAVDKVEVKAAMSTAPTTTVWTRELSRPGGNVARLEFESGDISTAGTLELEVTIYWTATRTETLPDTYTITVVEQKS